MGGGGIEGGCNEEEGEHGGEDEDEHEGDRLWMEWRRAMMRVWKQEVKGDKCTN